jgi:hypothetical protein
MLLGCAWLERGKGDVAEKHLERALRLNPGLPGLHRWIGYLRIWQEDYGSATVHMDAALKEEPGDRRLAHEASLVRDLAGVPPEPVDIENNPGGRLRFARRYERTHHRSGWRYAVNALQALHSQEGVLFWDFLEEPFAWQHLRSGKRSGPELLKTLRSGDYESSLTAEERRIVPFREPWTGFLHNPPNMPAWFHWRESPQAIMAKSVWKRSLPFCKGLFCLSEYAARWLRQETGKPVSPVLHPTETPERTFDFERFLANPRRQIVQIGWWLRRQGAIERLPVGRGNPLGFTKLKLVPRFFENSSVYLEKLREIEEEHEPKDYILTPPDNNTVERQHVPDDEYDRLLSENICFLDLYDTSANNAVVECLVRTTPVLVNRLPAVIEYLGEGYPLYFSGLEDAGAKALDLGRLKAAHEYLSQRELRSRLDGDSFRRQVEASEVYQSL